MRFPAALAALILTASAAFSADPALLNLVMPDARVVAGIDVARARDSYLGRKFLEQIDAQGSDMAKFAALTGFDPRRDLQEVVLAAPDAKTRQSPMLIAVRGAFDTGRISGFLKATGLTPAESVSGIDLYVKPNDKSDSSFAFIDSGLAVAGSRDLVRAALARRSASGPAIPAPLYAKAQSLSAANDMWIVTSIAVSTLSNALPGPKSGPRTMMDGDAFKSIEQSAMGIHLGADKVDVTAEAVSRTEKDASSLTDVIRFLSSLVLMNRNNPELSALSAALEAMTLTTEARTTKVSISLPVAELEKIMRSGRRAATAKI